MSSRKMARVICGGFLIAVVWGVCLFPFGCQRSGDRLADRKSLMLQAVHEAKETGVFYFYECPFAPDDVGHTLSLVPAVNCIRFEGGTLTREHLVTIANAKNIRDVLFWGKIFQRR